MQNALNRKSLFSHALIFFIVVFISVMSLTTPLKATTVTYFWSGASIQMGDDLSFKPEGTATFVFDGSQLVITLTNTTPTLMKHPWQVLTGLTFGTNSGVTLTSDDAEGSSLVGSIVESGPTILNDKWAFKALSGGFGISAVGSLNGTGVFGPGDLFDPQQVGPSPNGVDYGIVGSNITLAGGFLNQSPYAQSQMVFTLDIAGASLGSIHNIQPIFGSEGKFLVPEPSTIILLGFGFLVFGGITKFRRRK